MKRLHLVAIVLGLLLVGTIAVARIIAEPVPGGWACAQFDGGWRCEGPIGASVAVDTDGDAGVMTVTVTE